MDLIKKIYDDKKDLYEERPYVYFYDLDNIDKLMMFINDSYFFDTDLSYDEIMHNIIEIFSRLGFTDMDSIFLHNFVTGKSRFDINKDGYCSFSYSVNSFDYDDNSNISYYCSKELFDGSEKHSIYPGIKLISGNTSLCYTVGTGPYIKKYDIKIDEDITLTREFPKNEVIFRIANSDRNLIIKIKKPVSKVVINDYILENELQLIDYLKNLSSDYDIVEIYNKLCELSLGKDLSMYPEITLCELYKTNYGYRDKNLITIKNGCLDCIIRSIGDKIITLYGNGNWNYVLSDENVDFKINSGKSLKYQIITKNEKMMDDYTDSLLKYDVDVARCEVEDTKKLVREKFGLKR